ncbi:AraC family transcriptional regulator [Piscinibacter sp. HJYY11]|uniref:AraC family transcriptional regulator n=1 Tax=Piscinibacter sp. HJYY11 TaxID=2801333 RepID=UPI00191F883E|nr:AraC family transcriptional regulator [Piscinibacter sp. HJYY11]MBL0727254.1 AraC family transcriptional regulator [Piscinibacter sp. HJYY11]
MANDLREAVERRTEGQSEATTGVVTPVRGLYLVRRTSPSELEHTVVQPMVCLVLQGCKRVSTGSGSASYAAGDTMIVTGNVPTVSRITKASVTNPYLALAFDLDLSVIKDLVTHAPEVHSRPSGKGTHDELRDALRRLVLLLDRPESLAVLKNGLIREIHHWMLLGQQGPAIRHLGLPDSNARRIAKAVKILRANYAKPVQIERLAAAASMSRSGFHQHFRAITSLTPLQFQKQLRLIEARRLIVSSGKILSQIAFEVGYESASQFSREYTRMYGRTPTRDKRATTSADQRSFPSTRSTITPDCPR